MNKPTEVDWARLAAFIDGEGSIVINKAGKNGTRFTVRISISNTDPRLIHWIKNTFGGSVCIHRVSNPKHRDSMKWDAACREAQTILQNCYQYLIIKREQADVALAYYETVPTQCMGSTRIKPEVIEKRQELRDKISRLKKVSLPMDVDIDYTITSDDLM
jgi:hypothetical protein